MDLSWQTWTFLHGLALANLDISAWAYLSKLGHSRVEFSDFFRLDEDPPFALGVSLLDRPLHVMVATLE